jgi:hypothetical protein
MFFEVRREVLRVTLYDHHVMQFFFRPIKTPSVLPRILFALGSIEKTHVTGNFDACAGNQKAGPGPTVYGPSMPTVQS